MTSDPSLLLVAPPSARENLLSRIDRPGLVQWCAEPYQAIGEMAGRRWPAVAVAWRGGDLPGLCRAARRLQDRAGLFALCPPVDEPTVRPLVGRVLDDYFIYPPTRGEVSRLCRAATAVASVRGTSGPAARTQITPGEFAHMTAAARSVEALERGIAEVVAQRLDQPVHWVDLAEAGGARPLLLAANDRPRVLVARRRGDAPDPRARQFIAAVQDGIGALFDAARRVESLHHLAVTDHLTGTYNRRYFYYLTDLILRHAAERGLQVTLLLYDIDDFKRYNDTYGYAAGDEILRDTAAMMKDITRAHDIVARIGGDEFAVLFWEPDQPRSADSAPPESAYALADRFRRAVTRHHFPSLGPDAVGALTVSGGLAAFGPGARTCRDLLRQANTALKAGKDSGKNAIHLVGAWPNGRA